MGTENNQYQKNHGVTSPGKLLYGDTCNPIGVDIFITIHKEYRRHVLGSVEYSSGNLFSLPFLQKIKSHTPHHRSSNYDASQEIHTGPL